MEPHTAPTHARQHPVTSAGECPTTASAADFMPGKRTLKSLALAAQTCRGCSLYCHATQAVFGEGPKTARIFLIGEQPGDQEDLAGKPFVGPAGRILNDALAAAGLDRRLIYITNAVKHFKWTPRGKRRLHSKPTYKEVMACRPWLIEELRLISPDVTVCMGATAAQSLLGRDFRLTQHRQEFQSTAFAARVMATVHPSSLLRIPDHDARAAAKADFAKDFEWVKRQLQKIAH